MWSSTNTTPLLSDAPSSLTSSSLPSLPLTLSSPLSRQVDGDGGNYEDEGEDEDGGKDHYFLRFFSLSLLFSFLLSSLFPPDVNEDVDKDENMDEDKDED